MPFPTPQDLPDPEIEPGSPALQADALPTEPLEKPDYIYAAAKSLQSCPTLCDPIYSSPPGSAVPWILQARTLEWVAVSFSMRESKVAQSCLTLSNPMDCSPPGSSIHGIFQG